MSIWVTSDLHIGHDKEFMYRPRGFDSIEEHDAALVKNWNELVSKDDDVYILGDLMLNDNNHGRDVLSRLNGHIHIIYGNHDSDSRKNMYRDIWNVVEYLYADVIGWNGFTFYLSHYPTLCSNRGDGGKKLKHLIINLCGHTHTNDKWSDWNKGYIYHCELDAHDMKPVSLDSIIEDLIDKCKNTDN